MEKRDRVVDSTGSLTSSMGILKLPQLMAEVRDV